jgi:hypothetical protein
MLNATPETKERLLAVMAKAQTGRTANAGWVKAPNPVSALWGSNIPQWQLQEAEALLEEVNLLRARAGRPPTTLMEIVRCEISATGSDYSAKYALRCADLVLSRDVAVAA